MCYVTSLVAAQTKPSCMHSPALLKRFCQRLHSVWNEGQTDLYLSGYAWHNRYTYSPQKIATYNELAWGGGFGKGLFDEDGDWHGLYAIGFLDSHRHVEPVVGYAFLKIKAFSPQLKFGLGYSLLVTSRVDIYNGIPFPGALPWASVFYKRASIAATYIPGSAGAGNVLYLIAKVTL